MIDEDPTPANIQNGEWRDRERVWIVVEPGMPYNEVQLTKSTADGLVQVLAYRTLRVHQDGQWEDGESSICDVSILDVVHGLLRPAWAVFCARKGRADQQEDARARRRS